jgi:AcrR family transcriptional regulator
MTRHAFAEADKAARRATILRGARSVFECGTGILPSAREIAGAAGLAKGTLYLYFQSKEEIFATLLVENWVHVLNVAEDVLKSADGDRFCKLAAFLSQIVRDLDARPEILRLDALGYGLDQKLSEQSRSRIHLAFVGRLAAVGATIDRELGFSNETGVRLLYRSYALTRGLWQTTECYRPTEGADPALRFLRPRFADELAESLAQFWRGAMAVA